MSHLTDDLGGAFFADASASSRRDVSFAYRGYFGVDGIGVGGS